MVDGRFKVPLSPPTSPRMSDTAVNSSDYPYHRKVPHHQHAPDPRSYEQDSVRSLPPYRNLPHPADAAGARGEPQDHPHLAASSDPDRPNVTEPQRTASPTNRLTPRSPESSSKGHADEDDDDDVVDFDGEDQEEGAERTPMTAAELRAQKRKMKRFRFVFLGFEPRIVLCTAVAAALKSLFPDSRTIKLVSS